ncbi:MAG: serine--tRNA ligase [Candidatus Krumholzibacteriia bacterium]|nr:serine--tRNA ligase [Candidatus Latescibacterota bacterium]MCB9515809.1 serine--tRNA ligase [Candidatus Latescibacterota bacterium]
MLDRKFIRQNPDAVRDALTAKNESGDLDAWLALDTEHLDLLREVEELKARRNQASESINRMKQAGEDASAAITETRELAQRIKELDARRGELEAALHSEQLRLPNLPHASVPVGGEDANQIVKTWGDPDALPVFERQAHWDIGETLGIMDMPRGAKVAGSGFPLLMGDGARLQRALVNFMLDLHREAGFTEVSPPLLVNSDTATGTGQLPKSAEQMYHCEIDDLWLLPTAEVPVTNIYRDELLEADDLPRRLVAYTPCFRREAGAHGKDTRGLLRVHQFDKVELVKFVAPETSYDELESLLAQAEKVLQTLELPYRVLVLATGDLSFAAAKCYDIEIWSAGVGRWLEVSSVSNFEDFQARRANIRFRPAPGEKPQFVHTLNGSGTALARLMAALLENGQTPTGKVRLPEALRPYLGGQEYLQR